MQQLLQNPCGKSMSRGGIRLSTELGGKGAKKDTSICIRYSNKLRDTVSKPTALYLKLWEVACYGINQLKRLAQSRILDDARVLGQVLLIERSWSVEESSSNANHWHVIPNLPQEVRDRRTTKLKREIPNLTENMIDDD